MDFGNTTCAADQVSEFRAVSNSGSRALALVSFEHFVMSILIVHAPLAF
jgi:hypothetical protein